MRHKIVVTGMGCISPLGNSVDSTWDGISKGKSGIRTITKFDASEYRSQMAGEVSGFDPGNVITPAEARKMDIFIQYALAAAKEAFDDSQLDIDEELSLETGVSVGIGLGGLTSIEKWHNVILEKGPRPCC